METYSLTDSHQLSAVPNDIKRYSADVADYVDKHLERVSNVLREALSQQEWLGSARPHPPPPPPQKLRNVPMPYLSRVYTWVEKNKLLTCAIVLVSGGVIYYGVKKTTGRKKRRAKRATNGARLEVVVIAGSPSEPITKSLSQDLERRGFIVYIVCNSTEEEAIVQNESRTDVRPLLVDISDVCPSTSIVIENIWANIKQTESAEDAIERFITLLRSPHHAFQGARSHNLTLRSLILVPSQSYPTTPLATISPSTLSDLFNTRLLTPLLTLRIFLPLLHSSPFPQPKHATPKLTHKPSVLLLTPGIISSLNPAFHVAEATINNGLSSSASVLKAELSPLNIPFTHFQLGSFDFSSFLPTSRQTPQPTVASQRAETLLWDASSRQAYSRNFVAVTTKSSTSLSSKGSSLRELNDAVFDAMMRPRGGIVKVGLGINLYSFVGRWVPGSVVGWMLGLRRNENVEGGRERDVEFGRMLTDGSSEEGKSRSVSPEFDRERVYKEGSQFLEVDGEFIKVGSEE